jgi:hypothetical protein
VPELLLYGGSKVTVPDAEDIAAIVSGQLRERARGIKFMRFPQVYGTAAASKLSVGAAFQVGPDSGYVWSLLRVIVNGMTTGATPDVVNLYVNDAGSQPLWQFNGNNFGYTFGPGEIIINPGEILFMQSVGTFAATGTITMSGGLVEVPAEMAGKLLTV